MHRFQKDGRAHVQFHARAGGAPAFASPVRRWGVKRLWVWKELWPSGSIAAIVPAGARGAWIKDQTAVRHCSTRGQAAGTTNRQRVVGVNPIDVFFDFQIRSAETNLLRNCLSIG